MILEKNDREKPTNTLDLGRFRTMARHSKTTTQNRQVITQTDKFRITNGLLGYKYVRWIPIIQQVNSHRLSGNIRIDRLIGRKTQTNRQIKMNRQILYTETEVDDMVRNLFPADYELTWYNSDEGVIAVDPYFMNLIRRFDRQVRYRKRRDESLNRDQPPRLPCRPWYNNGDEYDWEDTRQYHQPRVYQEEIDPKNHMENEDMCYTCMNHRFCTGPVCEARVLTCRHCESEEGPLRVRENKKRAALAKKLV